MDIVEQLRECAGDYSLFYKDVGREAADEITRLRADLALAQGQRDEAVQKMQAGWVEVCDTAVLARNRELEAEVKRLRDENAGLRKTIRNQMACSMGVQRYNADYVLNMLHEAGLIDYNSPEVLALFPVSDAAMQKGE